MHECELSSAVAFAEGMDGIQLRQEARRALHEVVEVFRCEKVVCSQLLEQPVHLLRYVLREAEPVAALGSAYAKRSTTWRDPPRIFMAHR